MNNKILIAVDHCFLSPTNPIATADQRDLDALAIKVVAMPIVQQAKQQLQERLETFTLRYVDH